MKWNKFCSDLTLLLQSHQVPYSAAVRTYAWVERFHAVIKVCWAIDALEQRKKLFASSHMYTPFKFLLCVKYARNRNCWQFNAIASMVVKYFGWNLISLTLHNDLNAYTMIGIASTWIERNKLSFLPSIFISTHISSSAFVSFTIAMKCIVEYEYTLLARVWDFPYFLFF